MNTTNDEIETKGYQFSPVSNVEESCLVSIAELKLVSS